MDGVHALPNHNVEQGQYGDESPRVGLQHETSDEHLRRRSPNREDTGIYPALVLDIYLHNRQQARSRDNLRDILKRGR